MVWPVETRQWLKLNDEIRFHPLKRTRLRRQYFDLNVSGVVLPSCPFSIPPSAASTSSFPLTSPPQEGWNRTPSQLVWQLNYCTQWTCFNGKLSQERNENKHKIVVHHQPVSIHHVSKRFWDEHKDIPGIGCSTAVPLI